MNQTRRQGDSKRLETICELARRAKAAERLTNGLQQQLVDEAMVGATGLKAESSRRTFRSECRLAVEAGVAKNFDALLLLSERMWNERKIKLHSQYHILMRLCATVAGMRRYSKATLEDIDNYYTEFGALGPP